MTSRPKYPPTKHIVANGLPDAYHKLVKTCLTEGAIKRRFYGKPVNTYDMVSLTEINHPMLEPMLHPDFPTKELHCAEYEKQWERDYDWKKQGFEYNYMDRLIKYPQAKTTTDENRDYYNKAENVLELDDNDFIDQLSVISENITKRIKKGGECLVSNRDQALTWIVDRDMIVSEDQPCMQRLWFQIYSYPIYDFNGKLLSKGKADFHVEWRSRDLFSAWNSNMKGLIKMLINEIFEPNNLELIRVIDFCDSLHIYEADWEQAKTVMPAVLPPNLMM